ncbi:MAG: type II toxin-antitoxin system Phd/YefM family antitoxin [Nitrospirae bacterium]|nr:type II toxin-antitoxin system Phd/YefM family antitoxin [Nitrospirota bacterium]
MKFVSMRELQKEASAIVGLAEKGEDIIITKHGKPAAVIYPLNEGDMEDYLIEHSPSIRKKIEAGVKDARAGRVTSIEDLLKTKRTIKHARAKA